MKASSWVDCAKTEAKEHQKIYNQQEGKAVVNVFAWGALTVVSAAMALKNYGLYGFFQGGRKELKNITDSMDKIDEE